MKIGQARLERILEQYGEEEIDRTYLELYDGLENVGRAFASLHARIDPEFEHMNYKAHNGTSGHFNADNSRELLAVIRQMDELFLALEKAGRSATLTPEYQAVMESARKWLAPSGGSTIPEGLTPIRVEKYDAVFELEDASVNLRDRSRVELKMVGEGAFAVVHKFTDPEYGATFARKKLKRDVTDRERERFGREYELMKNLDFPYILEVYRYDAEQHFYTMEYCSTTLEQYVMKKNSDSNFGFSVRRRIALQFLYGLNYIHSKGHCHKDLSLKNVLLRVYDRGAVTVKLSDFGLAKPSGSEFTKTDSEMRGTIVDPALGSFKDFQPVNDIYAAGWVLSYLFTGRKALLGGDSELASIIQKCSHTDPRHRYQKVLDIVTAVEAVDALTPSRR